MSNLLFIALAKTLLLAVIIFRFNPVRTGLGGKLAIAYAVGAIFGLIFFALFLVLVPAIAYYDELTFAFVTVNVTLSYGATAATVAVLPLDLNKRHPASSLTRERIYYAVTVVAALGIFAVATSDFLRAFSIGVILMSLAEIAALARKYSGPVSQMLHGQFRPLGTILAVSVGLGVFYEGLNLAFPVWDWVTFEPLPPIVATAIMMSVGYIVLIHPLYVVTRLLLEETA